MQLGTMMTTHPTPSRGLVILRTVLIAVAAFVLGILLTIGATMLVWRLLIDDSRASLTLGDVVASDTPGFDGASPPSSAACGDRLGCLEGVEGDGVAVYRYASLDLARQATVYNDADLFYRSDRFVVELEDGALTPDERFILLQGVEGPLTGSSD